MLIGVVAAKLQSPFLMNMNYKVRLPDHDFPVAGSHCLIPSVYGIQEIAANGFGDPKAVSYSGPTHIAIRSGKHSSSTAATHTADTEKLVELEGFKKFMLDTEGNVKPVLIMKVDGGPDENPRFFKTIVQSISLFKYFKLDALFVACNAPGLSAFNPIERKMASFSRVLGGLVLPHDHLGSHLNGAGQTVDEDLEKRNFQYAGETLADVWSGMIIDGHPVTAEYIGPEEVLQERDPIDPQWYVRHVRESQYLLQVN